MPRLRDLLYRFRPLGTPGSATRPGVPIDRDRAIADELEPVFASLATTLADCRATVEEGRRRAAMIAAHNVAATEQLLETAPARAAAARATAEARARAEVRSRAESADVDTENELTLLRKRLRDRLPACRQHVAASVEALLGPDAPRSTDPGERS